MKRVAGLDSIRLICALVVVFFHNTSPPILEFLSRETPVGRLVLGLYDAAFNGQAAVIAFFLISGFCIHYPYATGRAFSAGPFLLGRFARLLIPTGAYLLILQLGHFHDTGCTLLLWSIWCELAYYALYPLLRLAFARTSVGFVLACSYAVSIVVTTKIMSGGDWQGLFNIGFWTWAPGLPCWLLGCLLAERLPASQPASSPTTSRLWRHRFAVAGYAYLSYFGLLHWHVSLLISLQVFAIGAWFWLRAELAWYREHPASPALERLGAITFSIYLIHSVAKALWENAVSHRGMIAWAGEICFILAVSAVFYFLIEKPSHTLARFLARTSRSAGIPIAEESSAALPLTRSYLTDLGRIQGRNHFDGGDPLFKQKTGQGVAKA
jgi:peptidoglycan/LPS O-acetylase OafA/YrhL